VVNMEDERHRRVGYQIQRVKTFRDD
jgi:hypothetical protein